MFNINFFMYMAIYMYMVVLIDVIYWAVGICLIVALHYMLLYFTRRNITNDVSKRIGDNHDNWLLAKNTNRTQIKSK